VSGQKIVVLGTGGTIAGTSAQAGDNIGYTAGQVGVAQLLDAVPGLQTMAGDLLIEQVAQIDSKDMDAEIWRALALRCAHHLNAPEVRGIVITHGTDTLEETAWFLHEVLDAGKKPVVLTCSMRPSTALTPDGPQNLLDAVAVAVAPGARGVLAVAAGEVHGARHVQKVHPYRVHAFASADVGPLGFLEEGQVRLTKDWPLALDGKARIAIENIANMNVWPRVEIVMSHAGATGFMVDALVRDGVQGLVVACTGNGTIHHHLEAALLRAQAAGVAVVRATRCPEGQVLPKPGDPLPDSQGLSPVKARIALMLDLLR
jgi:L-asparaginase